MKRDNVERSFWRTGKLTDVQGVMGLLGKAESHLETVIVTYSETNQKSCIEMKLIK